MYVSANPHTSLEAGDGFHAIDELWETNFDEDKGVVLPHVVKDAALNAHEQFPNKRPIVDFVQPHGPFVGSNIDEYDHDEGVYWRAYRDNLDYVFPYVDALVGRSRDGRS